MNQRVSTISSEIQSLGTILAEHGELIFGEADAALKAFVKTIEQGSIAFGNLEDNKMSAVDRLGFVDQKRNDPWCDARTHSSVYEHRWTTAL